MARKLATGVRPASRFAHRRIGESGEKNASGTRGGSTNFRLGPEGQPRRPLPARKLAAGVPGFKVRTRGTGKRKRLPRRAGRRNSVSAGPNASPTPGARGIAQRNRRPRKDAGHVSRSPRVARADARLIPRYCGVVGSVAGGSAAGGSAGGSQPAAQQPAVLLPGALPQEA